MRLSLVAAVAAALIATGVAAGGPKDPTRVQVSAREFSFTLSRSSLKAGEVIIEVVNFGMDPHDLKIRRMNNAGTVIGGTGVVAAGNRGQVDIKLGTGRYELYCTIANHESLGMRAYLQVERNSP